MTARTPGRGRTADGRSGYALPHDRLTGHRRVLGLGCGDGPLLGLLGLLAETPGRHLAGVDLSPDDLTLARRRGLPAQTALVQARAQQLPFAADAFDACAAHMTLMLMADAEQVAREAARVLRPGACSPPCSAAGRPAERPSHSSSVCRPTGRRRTRPPPPPPSRAWATAGYAPARA